MHILFLHSNFPAQFGQIASRLVQQDGMRCTFLNEKRSGQHAGIECVQFKQTQGANRNSHFCSATFENQIWKSAATCESLANYLASLPPDQRKVDLIVAHCGFVSPIFLSELLPGVPVIGYFEFFYHRHGSDFDFRHDLPNEEPRAAMRLRARNAMPLLDLHHCKLGYCPTDFQRAQMPLEYQPKLRTIFDGIDTDFWKRDTTWETASSQNRVVAGVPIPDGHHVITYVSRGFESMRGGDLFLRVAHEVKRLRKDVTFLVVGEDRVAYGGDARFTGGRSFRQWAIERHSIDTTNIHFVGRVSPSELINVFSASDLHLYWTVPFVLSWSMLNAMSCSCAVIGSDTAPVREMVRHGHNGWLVDFFDVAEWVDLIQQKLSQSEERRSMGAAARELVVRQYDLESCLNQMRQLYQEAVGR